MLLKIRWSSLRDGRPTGNGKISLYIDEVLMFTQKNAPQGDLSLDVSNYLTEGTHSIEVRAVDAYGNMDKVIQELNKWGYLLD